MSLTVAATNPGKSLQAVVAPSYSLAADAINAKKPVMVQDSLANLTSTGTLDALKKNIKNISSIKINLPAAGNITFTGEQLTKYADVIAKISDNRQINATDVNMASLSSVLKNKNVASVTVKDSSANISAGIGQLIANNSKIVAAGITRSDAADANSRLTVSSSNYTLANATGGIFATKFATTLTGKVNVTSLTTSQISAANLDGQISKISISDTSSNLVDAATGVLAGSKVAEVKVSAVTTKKISAADYTTFKSTANYSAIVTGQNPNALKNAFEVNKATFTNASATGTLALDTNVKSIAVEGASGSGETITGLPATDALSAKVTKVDLIGSRNNFQALGALDKIVALGGKLGKVKINDADTVTVDAGYIRSKAGAFALAKTQGQTDQPANLEVTAAKLADVNGLYANKQVIKAEIADSAKNMLAFSADKFAALANLSNVTVTIKDNATNVSKYHTELVAAINSYADKFKLDVTDTAANLGSKLDDLHAVASAITGATPNSTRIAIHQVNTSGAVDFATAIKATVTQYNSAHDILDYVKLGTAGMASQHVAIETSADLAGVNEAKNISFQLQVAHGLQLSTPAIPTGSNGVGTQQTVADINRSDLTKYTDVKKINLYLTTTYATSTLYGNILGDGDLSTSLANSVTGLTSDIGLNISVTA